tara:strand:+ start:163 stop:462 length:300 start_codon:yes stop_codon:yes gene_type:complete
MKLGQNIKILLLLWGHVLLVPVVLILDLKHYADIIWVSYAFIASAYFLHKRTEFKDHLLYPYLFATIGNELFIKIQGEKIKAKIIGQPAFDKNNDRLKS